MTLPNDEFMSCELSLEELDAVAAGGFWSSLKHAVTDAAIVVGKIGVGVAIVVGLFGGVCAAVGSPLAQPKSNLD